MPVIDYNVPIKLLHTWPKLSVRIVEHAKNEKTIKQELDLSSPKLKKRAKIVIKPEVIGLSLAHTNLNELDFDNDGTVMTTSSTAFINRIDVDNLDIDAFLDKYESIDDPSEQTF